MPRIPIEESVQGKLAAQEARIQELQEEVLKLQEEVKQLKKENRTLRRQKSMLDLEEEEEEIWIEVRSVPKSSLDWAPVEWVLNLSRLRKI